MRRLPYPGEQYIHSVDRYQIEVMDHLDELPATGAVIFCALPCSDGVDPTRFFVCPRVAHVNSPCAHLGIQSIRRPLRGRLLHGEMIHMQINKVTFIGKGGVGLLYGSMIAQALGNDAVEYVMDDTRFERHAGDALTVNGKPCELKSVRASEATPADLVILTVKTTGLDQALKTMERVVGPNTLIASLCNGITSEQKIAERFGWEHTVLGICQGMDAVFLNGELTFTNAGEIRFGAAAGTELATVTAIDELYTRCGIAHTVESDIAHRMWAKLMLNDGINQTCMAYGGTYGSATEPGSEQRRCFVSAMRETLAVANAEGIELTEADLTQMVHLIEGIDPTGMPSMAQDRIAQRKTEVEEFAGTICRLAVKHDIQVPQNDWLYQRIRDIEKSW